MLCHSGLILHWLIIHVLDTLLGNRQTLILAKENALALHIMFSRSHTHKVIIIQKTGTSVMPPPQYRIFSQWPKRIQKGEKKRDLISSPVPHPSTMEHADKDCKGAWDVHILA